ncbi:MAG: acyltransferase [Planctomycetaceae bacterium]|nr:acyltransferase [Planctomycetaceae bacterium]
MKVAVKKVVNCLTSLTMLSLAALYWTLASLCGGTRVFPGFAQLMSLCPGLTGAYLRRGFYQWILTRCEKDVFISFGTVFSHPGVTMGEAVYIGVGCMIGDVELQKDVLIGSHVSVINGSRQHGIERLDLPVREQPGEFPRVVIGEDTWIGDRAIVMADVGRHCVVGAGAVVTRPLNDYEIAVGNPARVIGTRKTADDTEDDATEESVSQREKLLDPSTQA